MQANGAHSQDSRQIDGQEVHSRPSQLDLYCGDGLHSMAIVGSEYIQGTIQTGHPPRQSIKKLFVGIEGGEGVFH